MRFFTASLSARPLVLMHHAERGLYMYSVHGFRVKEGISCVLFCAIVICIHVSVYIAKNILNQI